jgi:hypothetical protein
VTGRPQRKSEPALRHARPGADVLPPSRDGAICRDEPSPPARAATTRHRQRHGEIIARRAAGDEAAKSTEPRRARRKGRAGARRRQRRPGADSIRPRIATAPGTDVAIDHDEVALMWSDRFGVAVTCIGRGAHDAADPVCRHGVADGSTLRAASPVAMTGQCKQHGSTTDEPWGDITTAAVGSSALRACAGCATGGAARRRTRADVVAPLAASPGVTDLCVPSRNNATAARPGPRSGRLGRPPSSPRAERPRSAEPSGDPPALLC